MKWKIGGFLTLLAALAVAGPLIAQGPRGRMGPAREGSQLERLENILELNAAQTASAEALFEQHRTSQQGLMDEMRQARQNLQALVDAGNDPTAIGNAVLAQEAIQDRISASREALLADFKNLLTTAQREQFETLEEARGLARLGPFGGRGPGRAPFR